MRHFIRPLATTAFVAAAATGFSAIPFYAQTTTAMSAQIVVLSPAQDALRVALEGDSSLDAGIGEFYAMRNYRPVWMGAADKRDDLYAAIEGAGAHGLAESAYDLDGLRALALTALDDVGMALAEIAHARNYVDLARDLNTGVLQPNKVYSTNFYKPEPMDASLLMRHAASVASLGDYMDELPPQTEEYARLMAESVRLQNIIASGDYGAEIPANRLMRPGYTGDRTLLVRSRLKALGYGELGESNVYDEDLVAVVKTFQEDQRLKPDGVLGPATIGALNASASDRLEQVVINLERRRWLNHDLGERHIKVNIADFTMAVFDNDIATFRSKVVVGKSIWDQQTPEFSDQMSHMVVNPYWHVPKSIARKEYLPMLQQDPLALARRGLLLINRRGQVLDTSGADFSSFSQTNFPFDIKQPPGRSNALGLVKFMFPNKHNIYLHDTPAKRLFGRERRAYSHGCVRVEKPFELAYHLLSLQESDPEAAFRSLLNTGRERRVNLDNPVPIYLTYDTAFMGEDGSIVYRTDVYGRDKAMLKALKAEGVFATLDG